jgi:hypothetical protein
VVRLFGISWTVSWKGRFIVIPKHSNYHPKSYQISGAVAGGAGGGMPPLPIVETQRRKIGNVVGIVVVKRIPAYTLARGPGPDRGFFVRFRKFFIFEPQKRHLQHSESSFNTKLTS